MNERLAKDLCYLGAMTTCAAIEAAGMEAENMQRHALGQSMAYVHADFMAVIDKYGIHHNAILSTFQRSES